MTSRPLAVASLLMIAAALGSEPSTAAELGVAAYAGPNLDVIARDGPLVLPGPAVPTSTPQIDPSSINRDIVTLDFDELLETYATVTHLADGTTTVTPASADLRAVLEQEYAKGRI